MIEHTYGKAWLSAAIAHAMCDEADRTFPLETGGVLLGYWVDKSSELVISHAIGPGPRAINGAQSFVPDYKYQEAEVARLYAETGRVSTYLGDWHSHPLEGVYLSRRDLRTLRRIANHAEARAPLPVMIVIGGGAPNWSFGIWRYAPRGFGKVIYSSGIIPFELSIYDG
jgi:integrative and conjugative element protein (TIGR02256 family)